MIRPETLLLSLVCLALAVFAGVAGCLERHAARVTQPAPNPPSCPEGLLACLPLDGDAQELAAQNAVLLPWVEAACGKRRYRISVIVGPPTFVCLSARGSETSSRPHRQRSSQ